MSTGTDELKARLLERTQRMLEAKVDDVMTRDVVTVDFNDLSAKAARLILENGFLGLLVVKDGQPFNMVTAHDLLRLGYEETFDADRDYLRLKVGELVKDKEFLSVAPGTKLREALNVMVSKKTRTLAVIQDRFLHGILSMTDLMKWYRDTHEEVRTGRL